MTTPESGDLSFTFRVTKDGTVFIEHFGKPAATLRGRKATSFIDTMARSSRYQQQQVMARLTGNYKRGNERSGKNHPKNR